MNVLGLDLSLNSSGYAYRAEGGGTIVTGRIQPKAKVRGTARLAYNRERLTEVILEADDRGDHAVTLAAVEGYAMGYAGKKGGMGAPPGRLFDIGEWGRVARLVLYDGGIPMVIVSPSTLKMFATGNGGSAIKKPHVIQAITDVWGYEVPQHDEADAFVLMMLGEAYQSKRVSRKYGQDCIRALDSVHYIDAPGPF